MYIYISIYTYIYICIYTHRSRVARLALHVSAPCPLSLEDARYLPRVGWRVYGFDFRVQGSRFGVQGSGFRLQGATCPVPDTGRPVASFSPHLLLWVSGSGFQRLVFKISARTVPLASKMLATCPVPNTGRSVASFSPHLFWFGADGLGFQCLVLKVEGSGFWFKGSGFKI